MSECPWCHAPITEPRFPCGSCGKRPKDHASYADAARSSGAPSARAPMGATVVTSPASPPVPDLGLVLEAPATVVTAPRSRRSSADDLDLQAGPSLATEVPDLVLELPRASKPAAPAQPAPAKQPRGPVTSAASMSLDEDMELVGNAIELDSSAAVEEPADAAPVVSRPPGDGSQPSGRPVALSQRPSKKPKDDDARAAAARLGDYGDAPTEWWMAPVYAYRVKMRQLELRRELATKKAALDTARGAADDVLVALAQRGRKHVEHNDEYAKLLQTLKAAEAGLRERDSALAAETDAHGQKTAGIDEQIGHVEAELAALRADEKTAVEHFERLDAVRQRADAKAKRIEIELRAAIAKAGPPPSKSGLPRAADVGLDDPEVVAKTRERDARLAEVQQATPAVTEATKDLAACRKRVTSVQEKLLDLKNQRAAIEAQWKRRGAHHGAEVEKAEKAVRAAFAALGRACATDNSTFGPEWDEARKEIVALDKTAAARDEEVVLHAMALDAHDRATTQRGIVMVASIAALLAVLCVLPFVFSGSTHKEAAAAAPPTDQGE